jgi:tRNA(fMet)-specific endonuclease VapC
MKGDLYLLDTDTCIALLRGEERVIRRVRQESPDDVAVSAMTEAELAYGALKSSSPKRNRDRVEALLAAPFEILPFDREAARCHAELRFALRSQPIGERDLVIASIAVSRGRVLVTGNRREFERVPHLALVNWIR